MASVLNSTGWAEHFQVITLNINNLLEASIMSFDVGDCGVYVVSSLICEAEHMGKKCQDPRGVPV